VITPKEKITQVLYAHFIVLAPGGKSDKHGHMNEAMFYILDGKGHEIHDGVRYDWEAGDVVVTGDWGLAAMVNCSYIISLSGKSSKTIACHCFIRLCRSDSETLVTYRSKMLFPVALL
jgi:uncharacterized RmlC-like cupin family protein